MLRLKRISKNMALVETGLLCLKKIGLKRCGKSCRLRWLNYLRPNIKHGGFSEEEDRIICSLYVSIGSRWSIIASQLPGRTDNDIKNYWNTRLKKKLLGKQRKDQIFRGKKDLLPKKGRSSPSEIPSSIVVSGNENMDNQDPYLPDQLPVMPPMPYLNQEPRFVDDHTSIRKLLIMLGGKFSSNDNFNQSINMVSQFRTGNTLTDLQESSQNDHNFITCSTDHVSSISSSPIMPLNSQCNMLSIQGGQNGTFSFMFDHDLYYSTNPQQKVDGLEFLYGDMCEINTSGSSSVITCGDNMDWGEMNSLISTTTTTNGISLSNYQRSLQQEVLSLHDRALDDDSNSGVH